MSKFTDYYGTPLPSDTEDTEKWAQDLLAALDVNLTNIQKSINSIGDDLRQLAADIAP